MFSQQPSLIRQTSRLHVVPARFLRRWFLNGPACVCLGRAVALSLMGGWSRSAVLELYRALLRAGRHLQYTDRNYYRRAVAREFRRCQALSAPQEKEDALKRGQFFLNSRLGGLV
ncbi:hypothetical protein AALO_G00079150 [Alosa alosa]|uniref:Complex 1 LYR protein domain-containing protein n=1 Tax=Alosa alosa TaxID=278164 RepID=A0AAV6GYU5_9TELE|nr:hypothetical protein AALO_G00079150 [Alosa alosa]